VTSAQVARAASSDPWAAGAFRFLALTASFVATHWRQREYWQLEIKHLCITVLSGPYSVEHLWLGKAMKLRA
jgi:hypothetical protein